MPPKSPVTSPQALKELWRYNLNRHELTNEGHKRVVALISAACAMADAIVDLTPPGRDQAMALSCNEELLFHAVAAVERSMNAESEQTPEEDQKLKEENHG
jgi:hypothetical protein